MNRPTAQENQELVHYIAMYMKCDGILPKDTRTKQEKKESDSPYSPEQLMFAVRWLDEHRPGWSVRPKPQPNSIVTIDVDDDDEQ